QDERLLDRYGMIHDEISSAFPEGTQFRRWIGYGRRDLSSGEDAVRYFRLGPMFQLERLERGLSFLLDHDRKPSIDAVRHVLENPRAEDFPLLVAQAERAMGLAERDRGQLDRSLALLERVGALPYAARVRCERALIAADRAETAAGLRVLAPRGAAEQAGLPERPAVGRP